jgi:hypothetical protein
MPNGEGSSSSRRPSLAAGVLGNLPGALIILVILASFLGIVDALSYLAGHVYGIVGYVFAIGAALAMYRWTTDSLSKHASGRSYSLAGDIVRYVIILLWVPFFIVVCSQLFRQLYDVFGGFASPYDDYWHWVLFGASWFVDDVLLGATEVFNWNVSSIHPIMLWSKAAVLIFNVTLQLIVITSVVRIYQLLRSRRHWKEYSQAQPPRPNAQTFDTNVT